MRIALSLGFIILMYNLSFARNHDIELRLSPLYYEIPYFSYKVDNSNKSYFRFKPEHKLSAGYYSLNMKFHRPNNHSWGGGFYYLNTRKSYTLNFDDTRYLKEGLQHPSVLGWRNAGIDMQYNTQNLGFRVFYTFPIGNLKINTACIIGAEFSNNTTIFNHFSYSIPELNTTKQNKAYWIENSYSYLILLPDGTMLTPKGYYDNKFHFSPNNKKWDIEQFALEISMDYPIYKNKVALQAGLLAQKSYDYLSYNIEAGLKDGSDIEPLESFDLKTGYSFLSVFLGVSYKLRKTKPTYPPHHN